MVIQPALLTAVHAQPVPAATVTLPVAAAEVVRFDDVGEIVGAQGRLKPKLFERGVDVVPPGPTALTIDSYTTPGVSGVASRAMKSRRIIPSVPGVGFPRSAVCSGVAAPAT